MAYNTGKGSHVPVLVGKYYVSQSLFNTSFDKRHELYGLCTMTIFVLGTECPEETVVGLFTIYVIFFR